MMDSVQIPIPLKIGWTGQNYSEDRCHWSIIRDSLFSEDLLTEADYLMAAEVLQFSH